MRVRVEWTAFQKRGIYTRYLQISRHSAAAPSRSFFQRTPPLHPSPSFIFFIAVRPSPQDAPIMATGQQVTSDTVDDGPPISVPDSGDTGESGKLKMIVQLVRKCMGIKDIASMWVFTVQPRVRC